jgi:16S rRNA (adenine1518-N6/adenine1519-N6)-dimethyltransferase
MRGRRCRSPDEPELVTGSVGAGLAGAGAGPAPRLDPAAVRATLRDAGLRARRSLSQNFLADVDVLEGILAEAAPDPGRQILEIGPGLGILTEGLLHLGAAVVAVEVDPGMVRWLRERLAEPLALAEQDPGAAGGLRLVPGDVLDLSLDDLVHPPFDVVANLPYHVTSPVLHRLLGARTPPGRLVLMLQREVAERIAAPSGSGSYLWAFVQYHARVRLARIVPASAFEPAPKVDSAVVVLEPWSPDDPDRPANLSADEEDALWRLVQAAFRERRKMLHNVLRRQLPVPPERVDAALATVGIDPDRRPQTLSVAEWIALREALGPIGEDTRGRRGTDRAPAGDTGTGPGGLADAAGHGGAPDAAGHGGAPDAAGHGGAPDAGGTPDDPGPS